MVNLEKMTVFTDLLIIMQLLKIIFTKDLAVISGLKLNKRVAY